ncbi:MAG: hypothetical protein ACHQJX_02985 [Candidatus Acidiferrales bacterium]
MSQRKIGTTTFCFRSRWPSSDSCIGLDGRFVADLREPRIVKMQREALEKINREADELNDYADGDPCARNREFWHGL